MTTTPNKWLPIALVPVLLGFIYFFPRLLISRLGEANPWTSYFYQYGFGLVFFSIGIWIILRSGSCRLDRKRDRFWFGVLIFGFIFFATVHAVWITLALNVPYLGGA